MQTERWVGRHRQTSRRRDAGPRRKTTQYEKNDRAGERGGMPPPERLRRACVPGLSPSLAGGELGNEGGSPLSRVSPSPEGGYSWISELPQTVGVSSRECLPGDTAAVSHHTKFRQVCRVCRRMARVSWERKGWPRRRRTATLANLKWQRRQRLRQTGWWLEMRSWQMSGIRMPCYRICSGGWLLSNASKQN